MAERQKIKRVNETTRSKEKGEKDGKESDYKKVLRCKRRDKK